MPQAKNTSGGRKSQDVVQDIGREMGRIPPQALDVEEAVLGAMLLEPLCVDEALESLTGKCFYLERNRLIAGLADIVVVVEAAEQSGSLNTATHAIEQGKTVFAVPGNITNPYSQGCNKLIKQGAIPYTEPRDILELLFPEEYLKTRKKLQKQNLIGDTDVETLILTALSEGLRSGEEIMAKTHLPPEVFNQTTTLLEIKGRLRSLGMNQWGLT